jgi:hypothetical protein
MKVDNRFAAAEAAMFAARDVAAAGDGVSAVLSTDALGKSIAIVSTAGFPKTRPSQGQGFSRARGLSSDRSWLVQEVGSGRPADRVCLARAGVVSFFELGQQRGAGVSCFMAAFTEALYECVCRSGEAHRQLRTRGRQGRRT